MKLNVLHLMLHGDKSPEGQIKSQLAFDEFRGQYFRGVPFQHYLDSYGYPVYCIVVFINPHFTGGFVGFWDEICFKHGLAGPATSYEVVLDFDKAVQGQYILVPDGD